MVESTVEMLDRLLKEANLEIGRQSAQIEALTIRIEILEESNKKLRRK